jgi:F0F1-type ATP synthase membrane subunit a
MFFGVFEGVVQAFVLTMLSLTYLAVAVSGHESNDNRKVKC